MNQVSEGGEGRHTNTGPLPFTPLRSRLPSSHSRPHPTCPLCDCRSSVCCSTAPPACPATTSSTKQSESSALHAVVPLPASPFLPAPPYQPPSLPSTACNYILNQPMWGHNEPSPPFSTSSLPSNLLSTTPWSLNPKPYVWSAAFPCPALSLHSLPLCLPLPRAPPPLPPLT